MSQSNNNPRPKRLAQSLLASMIVLLVMSTFCLRAEGQTKRVTTEEYAIYSAILNAADNSTILNRKREFPSKGKIGGTYVIQTTTSGTINNYYVKQADVCNDRFPSSSLKPVFDNLLANNQRVYPFRKHFNLISKYRMLSAKRFADFFKEKGGVVGFEDFRRRYGERSAYYILSRVGFNPQKTKALVYAFEYCSGICAFSRLIQLNKVRGKWKVAKEFGC